jgi:hypothetical protein
VLIKNLLLYTVTVFVWGSNWLGIKFQLGDALALSAFGRRPSRVRWPVRIRPEARARQG